MKLELRALILAAGFGTRLRPITLKTPKCLVEIGGKPLLQKWFEILENIGCEKTLINTHYLSDKVDQFINNYQIKNMAVETVYEVDLLGTLGTLLANRLFFKNKTGMLIHGDNITNADLRLFIKAHNERPKECLLTMLIFRTTTPESCGIVETDKSGVMVDFFEKIKNPPSDIANGAIYLFDYDFIDWLEDNKLGGSDFSVNVLPSLKGRVQTWLTRDKFLDIGTPESLAKAKNIF
ncbi:MAG: nucleotidyl transferase [Candidatus Marinimicrobia bacterium]|mgnify:CR=1 FL=1|nr:nucleotidyl transferase [Candidatus Neomarinimicrobiota bacterium]|tara:strand:- start:999 stop:1706 length:708 start_codon:yes stop_codon:yes gene_type:complete